MIKTIIEEIQQSIERYQQRILALVELQPKVEALRLDVSQCNEHLDFDCLPHSNVIRVIAAFGGKWTKTPYEDHIHYTRDEPINGVVIRCWSGEPPPSCKIIEQEEDVPEQIIPASKRIVRKLVCLETGEALA